MNFRHDSIKVRLIFKLDQARASYCHFREAASPSFAQPTLWNPHIAGFDVNHGHKKLLCGHQIFHVAPRFYSHAANLHKLTNILIHLYLLVKNSTKTVRSTEVWV